jgi:hypothetical protein
VHEAHAYCSRVVALDASIPPAVRTLNVSTPLRSGQR